MMLGRVSSDWITWGILFSVCLLTIISAIVLFSIYYKKKSIKFLTVKKITYFATFLSIFVVSTALDLFLFKAGVSIEASIVVAFSFVFGPLEGMLFGWIADSLAVLMHGWSYQLLSSLIYPMVAIFAGTIGLIYSSRDFKIEKKWILPITQAILITIFLILFPLQYWMSSIKSSYIHKHFWEEIIMVINTFILTEWMFWYTWMKSDKGTRWSNESMLFMFLLIANIIERMITITIMPFANWFNGWYMSYEYGLVMFMIKSSYIIPLNTFVAFLFVKATFEFKGGGKAWQMK